jgi:hypothetical protein
MSEITKVRGGAIEQFDPERHRLHVAALSYGIEEAKRIKDWPALEAAVEGKIEEQQKFIAWWDVSVREDGRPGNGPRPRTVLTAPQAEDLTGIRKQRVADLRKSLSRLDLYRQLLLGPIYRRAHLKGGDARTLLKQGEGDDEWYTPAKLRSRRLEPRSGIRGTTAACRTNGMAGFL